MEESACLSLGRGSFILYSILVLLSSIPVLPNSLIPDLPASIRALQEEFMCILLAIPLKHGPWAGSTGSACSLGDFPAPNYGRLAQLQQFALSNLQDSTSNSGVTRLYRMKKQQTQSCFLPRTWRNGRIRRFLHLLENLHLCKKKAVLPVERLSLEPLENKEAQSPGPRAVIWKRAPSLCAADMPHKCSTNSLKEPMALADLTGPT